MWLSWWRQQTETFSALLTRSSVNSPHKGQWRGVLIFLWSAPSIKGWVNNREAGDLRHHRAHYDVIVILSWHENLHLPKTSSNLFQNNIRYNGAIIWSKIRTAAFNPGPWFNINMSSYRYRKSHCGDKTVVRSSYLHNGISYTGKMSSLYWIGALILLKYHSK